MALMYVPFNPRTLVEDTLRILSTRADEQNVALNASIHESVPDQVKGDSDRLRQVLLNLAGNAVKFTKDGQVSITLDAPTHTPSTLHFEVRDTGIGIDEKDIAALFKPFSQLDSATNRKYGGTGLGLAITKHLVEIMGGKIQVVSEKGKGSTFSFTVGVQPLGVLEKSPAAVQRPWTPDHFNGIEILAAEDNVINQKILNKILAKLGVKVDIAENGIETLGALRQKTYDLILMDIQMPEMDGFEATKCILDQYPPEQRPRIIACTANATDHERERCFAAGMDDFLVKPLKVERVAEVLAKWANKERIS
jgi:CheY-like chemotaxis protein